MLRGPPRVVEAPEIAEENGAPPEQFVEKISEEGGDVYIAPVLEALRAALKRYKDPSSNAPQVENEDTGTARP